ncbi:PhoH family protein [Sulfurivirga sp.]|uniref:PhoH family protein n=1 Tax=Sulfurivirga sp. TaxID=2614236 RepID=UPI0025DE422F|nr:PhoH family protein [Sulfurivirga sp.]
MSEHLLHSVSFELTPHDNERLQNLVGWRNEHLEQVELRLGVEVNHLGFQFKVTGLADRIVRAEQVIRDLYEQTRHETLEPSSVHLALQSVAEAQPRGQVEERMLRLRRKVIRTRNPNQAAYLDNLAAFNINFGVGPAGTGKTYLAVAAAVDALEKEQVRRIVLTRPAVEAGERLGFLPGDLSQKVDPYLRPLYDALYEMLGFETVDRLIEKSVIEIAPLAFMRGRTLNEAFIILDEAQNTTVEQMKMFLTRLGFGSRMVITGDITQCDLPRQQKSGLRDVLEVLEGVEGVGFTFFQAQDVVRHPLVQKIVRAYDQADRLRRETS